MADRQPKNMKKAAAPALVLCSVVSVQFGQATGKQLFGDVGPAGAVSLRLGIAAIALLLIYRPTLPSTRREGARTIGFGTAIAGMNLIYPAMQHLPLGMAISLQLLGPITLALLTSCRIRGGACAVLAGGGVWLFHLPAGAGFSPVGTLLALASGVAMAAYLVLSRYAGAHNTSGAPLALAVAWAALLTVPLGVFHSGDTLFAPRVLVVGLMVAVLSAVLPYSLELAALRQLPLRTVGTMQSLEPAVAGIAGALLLDEDLRAVQWLALGCIGLAAAGAVTGEHRKPPAHPS